MSVINDISDAIKKLQDMLSSEEGLSELKNMVSEASVDNIPQKNTEQLSAPKNLDAIASLAKIQSALSTLNSADDPRIRLLTALKPYLGARRNAQLDNAIKLVSLGQLPSIIKNIRG